MRSTSQDSSADPAARPHPSRRSKHLLSALIAGAAVVLAACDGPTSPGSCHGGAPSVLLLVDQWYRAPLDPVLARYADDLCAEGYSVHTMNYVSGPPPKIRGILADEWARSGHALVGAILIGNIPHAYQYVTLHSVDPQNGSFSEEAISFQYYGDVDGHFDVSSRFASLKRHEYAYDVHDGKSDTEIWIGVLPELDRDRSATLAALTAYFDKNHAYRTGGPKPPRGFIQVSEHLSATTLEEYQALLTSMKTGDYAWTPFSTEPSAQLYFNSATPAVAASEGYDALINGDADFLVQDVHGDALHSGEYLTSEFVRTFPMRTIFFWSNGCSVGDLDAPDNFATALVYSPLSEVLVAKATTNSSGGLGTNVNGFFGHNIATAMTEGASIGDALVAHVNAPLLSPWSNDREFHAATAVMVGDPTLTLRP